MRQLWQQLSYCCVAHRLVNERTEDSAAEEVVSWKSLTCALAVARFNRPKDFMPSSFLVQLMQCFVSDSAEFV